MYFDSLWLSGYLSKEEGVNSKDKKPKLFVCDHAFSCFQEGERACPHSHSHEEINKCSQCHCSYKIRRWIAKCIEVPSGWLVTGNKGIIR